MIRNLIRYIILIAVIITIVILLNNLFTKGNSNFSSTNKLNTNSKYYTASIRVLDDESRKFINGGKFVLKTQDGKIIEEWEGKENIHRVSKLKNGTYILEQKNASDGYEKADNIIFKINNSDKDVVMYNSVVVEDVITSNEVTVDNTLSVKSCLSYIISILIITSGFGLIFLQKRCYNK